MIKKIYNYILSAGDVYLLVILLAAILLIYGCTNYDDEKSEVNWNELDYLKKCSGENSKNSECKNEKSSGVSAIGLRGSR